MLFIYKQLAIPIFKKTVTIPVILLGKVQTPHLVVVDKKKPKLDCPYERKLCETLRAQNFYVSPFALTHRIEVRLALIPFRIALVNQSDPRKKRLVKAFSRIGWKIVYYETDELKRDFYEVIRRIHSATAAKTSC